MKQKNVTNILLGIIMLSSVICANWVTGVDAQEPESQLSRVMTVSVKDIQGTAQILSTAEMEKQRDRARVLGIPAPEAWKPLSTGTILEQGDRLRTGPDSTMELQLNDGTVVTLDRDTVLELEELKSVRAKSLKMTQFFLERGKIQTVQPTQILGQTEQIIRTNNGTINTRLGEVEVEKRPMEPPRLAAAPSFQWPLLAQNGRRDDYTTVTLNRGTADIQASGEGQMITLSFVLPESCLDVDGVRFTLKNAGSQVTLSKLEDESAFQVLANEMFQLLAGTEGIANTVTIINRSKDGVVDVEGTEVAELGPDSRLVVAMHELLTLGYQGLQAQIIFECDPNVSQDIGDLGILGEGDVTILRENLGIGLDASRPDPSRGSGVVTFPSPTPEIPTATPTPTEPPEEEEEEEEEEEPPSTPTPTPTTTLTPTPETTESPVGGPPQPPSISPPQVRTPQSITQVDPAATPPYYEQGSLRISTPSVSCQNGPVACGNGSCRYTCYTVQFSTTAPSGDWIRNGGLYLYDSDTCDHYNGEIARRFVPNDWPRDPMKVDLNGNTVTFSFCGEEPNCGTGANYGIRVSNGIEFGDCASPPGYCVREFEEASPCVPINP